MLSGGGASRGSLFPQLREEVHLKGMCEAGGRAEGEVHVLVQHLRDVGLGDLHALRKLGLIEAKLLHSAKDAPEKCRADVVDGLHELGEGEARIRSAPVAYAAEYATVPSWSERMPITRRNFNLFVNSRQAAGALLRTNPSL